MNIALLEAKCAKCSREFSYPELGDFAYAQFIFSGERGSVHAHFSAIEHPVWRFLDSVLPSSAAITIEAKARGSKLQAACAHFADPIEHQRLSNHIVCPHCFSSQLEWWAGDRTGVKEVPAASFTQFMSLQEEERRRVASAYFEAQPGAPADGSAAARQLRG